MPDTVPLTPQELELRVQQFIADARAKAADGKVTVVEFGSLVVALLRLAVAGLDSIPMDKQAKKAWALSAVAFLFDNVADRCIPLVARPVWWIARPAVRQLVLSAADGALEQVLSLVRAASPAVAVETKP